MKKVSFDVFRWDRDQVHILLNIVINSQEVYAILDSGASTSVIDKEFYEANIADFTEVPARYRSISNIGQVLKRVSCGTLDFGNNIVLSHKFYVADLQFVKNTYEQIDGKKPPVMLLGCDFLTNFVSSADFVENFICFR